MLRDLENVFGIRPDRDAQGSRFLSHLCHDHLGRLAGWHRGWAHFREGPFYCRPHLIVGTSWRNRLGESHRSGREISCDIARLKAYDTNAEARDLKV